MRGGIMDPEHVVVNDVDEPSDGPRANDLRRVSEYKPTNMPLSKFEIEKDEIKDTAHEGWGPRTTENIGDMTPLPEKPAAE
jgi:hypothetical protein